MVLPAPLRGIVPPMITPLATDDTLDTEGLHRLIERILEAGPAGLFVLGTTGEGPSLSYHLRRELVDRVCQTVSGRVPVLVGVTDTSFVESINVADDAAEAGADAVVLAARYYFAPARRTSGSTSTDLWPRCRCRCFSTTCPATPRCHFHSRRFAGRLDVPEIVGIKDSSGDMIYFDRLRSIVAERPDFTLLIGPEELLAEAVLLGGHGGVSGGESLPAALCRPLQRRRRRRSEDDLQPPPESHRVGLHDLFGRPAGAAVVQGIKTALSILGICSDLPAEPFHPSAPSSASGEKALDAAGPRRAGAGPAHRLTRTLSP